MNRLLMIAMDAADGELVLPWMAEGKLPALASLAGRGVGGRLESIAARFPDATWPTIATGCMPGTTGHYSWRCVRPRSVALVFTPNRSRRRPFWELAHDHGARTLIADVPRSALLKRDGATALVGWGQRAALRRESWPPELYGETVARHGRYPQWLDDDYGRSVRAQDRYRRTLMRMIDARTALNRELLERHDWDLALLSYSESHNAGHVFHRHLDPRTWTYDERRAAQLRDGLLEAYQAIDAGIGDLITEVGDDVDVLVFSGHGMTPNTSGWQLLPQLMERLGYTVPTAAPPLPRMLGMVRNAVPWSIRRHVNGRLSVERRTELMARMWAGAVDWRHTRVVAEAEAGFAWLRVNLRGREPHGTVEPGAEYERLRDELIADVAALVDVDTGEPAAAEVLRREEVAPGPHVDELPDVYVRWRPGSMIRRARHPRAGELRERLRDVASTEHDDEGFLVAAGPRIRRGAELNGAHVTALAPTALHMLGAPIPADMEGSPLLHVLDGGLPPPRREPLEWSDDPWAGEPVPVLD